MYKKILVFSCMVFWTNFLFGQNIQRLTGPVIEDYGATYLVENPDFQTDTTNIYKVVFDIYNSPDDPNKVNPSLNTLARFLNMHVNAGVPNNQLYLAGVVHNKATHDVLDNDGYRLKYGVDNPNEPLLIALEKTGVNLYICGQSISARGVERTKIHESVEVGLSAMTVILSLQSDGYQLIKF